MVVVLSSAQKGGGIYNHPGLGYVKHMIKSTRSILTEKQIARLAVKGTPKINRRNRYYQLLNNVRQIGFTKPCWSDRWLTELDSAEDPRNHSLM